MFISQPNQHRFNMKQATTYQAQPALLTAYDGSQEPAVVLYSTSQVKGVLPITEALRLANEIADAVDAHRAKALTEPKP